MRAHRVLFLAALAGCSATPTYAIRSGARTTPGMRGEGSSAATRRATATDGAEIERGAASFYSDRLAGNATANGERYDPEELTAAHRTLRFGTWVRVEREQGARVDVCINDRGPFVSGRVIDLSRAAAEALGMIRVGVAEVTLRVIGHSGRRRCE